MRNDNCLSVLEIGFRKILIFVINAIRLKLPLIGNPISDFNKEKLAKDKFLQNYANKASNASNKLNMPVLGTSGNLSIYLFEMKKVKYGLPILPKLFDYAIKKIFAPGMYAFIFFGNIELNLSENHMGEEYGKYEWVEEINSRSVKKRPTKKI